MGCHTWIYKKVTTVDDCIRLIEGAIAQAKEMYELESQNKDEFDSDVKETKKALEEYWKNVKSGEIIHNPDHVFQYFSDGRWLMCDEYTLQDALDEYQRCIDKCKHALNTLKTFKSLKKFIIDHWNYYGYWFNEMNLDLDYDGKNHDDLYTVTTLYDGEIYVHSDNIQHDAFKDCTFFRIYGYPCEEDCDVFDYYRTSPAGKAVYGWDNAADLIEFLDWYKNTENAKHQLPLIDCGNVSYDDEQLREAINKFFEVNKDNNLFIHFG